MAKLSFLGAAKTVTGSQYLVEAAGRRLMVDCGMFQGEKALRLLNWAEPAVDPASVDALVLTHTHLDHIGRLPRLVKQGFSGPIYCTPATRELAEILLLDAAHLQEEDAAYLNRKGLTKHAPALPLFDDGGRRGGARALPVAAARHEPGRRRRLRLPLPRGRPPPRRGLRRPARARGRRDDAGAVQRRRGPLRRRSWRATRSRRRRPTTWSSRAPTATARTRRCRCSTSSRASSSAPSRAAACC